MEDMELHRLRRAPRSAVHGVLELRKGKTLAYSARDTKQQEHEQPQYERSPDEADSAVEESCVGLLAQPQFRTLHYRAPDDDRISKPHADPAGAGGEQNTQCGIGPLGGLRTPAKDRVLEVPDHEDAIFCWRT